MVFLQMHGIVVSHDAVGNDIEIICEILKKQGIDCKVYTNLAYSKSVEYASLEETKEILSNPENVVIYHHSVLWKEGFKLLKEAKCKVVIRYHNVTPPEFFRNILPEAKWQCWAGRRQTDALQKKLPNAIFLADSKYNASELKYVSPEKVTVIAPFHMTEKWGDRPVDDELAAKIKSEAEFNLLFVGRVAPNKGHLDMLDVVKTYIHHYDNNIRLRIIGKMGSVPLYDRMIQRRIHNYGLDNNVEFIGEINDTTLATYYRKSDAMLCMSHHEGFCVPIIEAQYFELPIVALKSSAVTETMGENQMLYDMDLERFAAALHLLKENKEAAKQMADIGKANFNNRFAREVMEKQFVDFIEKLI